MPKPLLLAPDWLTDEDDTARNVVYLVTIARVLEATALAANTPLRALDDLSRVEVRDAILDAVRNPAATRAGGWARAEPLDVEKMVVFLEEPLHFHVALKLTTKSAFMPLKLALRQRSSLASHWSTSHGMFYSAVRYGYIATERKPLVDASSIQWTRSGAVLNLFEESQEPWNAGVLKRRREEAARCAAGMPEKKRREAGRFTKLDFMGVVVSSGLTTPAMVMEYMQSSGSDNMRAFATRHQRRLEEFIDDAQQWAGAPADAAADRESDWGLIQRKARQSCSCPGGLCQWWEAADDFLTRNAASIDRKRLAACLAKVIAEGPSKTARVPMIIGPTNAVKSTLFNPIDDVFGYSAVAHRPSEKASMALTSLTKQRKRFIFWDDYRPVEYASRGTVPVGTFLTLFGGQHLEIQVSQSWNNGHPDIKWRKGAALTAKEEGLWDLMMPMPGMTPVSREDIRHMQSRVEQFRAGFAIPEGQMVHVPNCGPSFCRWLIAESASFDFERGIAPVPRALRGRQLPPLPAGYGGNGDAARDDGQHGEASVAV